METSTTSNAVNATASLAPVAQQMYADMQTMIHQDAGIGIPLFLASIDGHSAKLKGLSPIPLGGLMGYNFAENVWLES